jgi:hypothetical protein
MASHVEGHVYVLHFDRPVSHARHYIGWAIRGGLERRIGEHRSGNGKSSPLVRALLANGGDFQVAAVIDGDRFLERRMKNQKNGSRHCPICKGDCRGREANLFAV